MVKNVIVGQSGGPTSVINASLIGVFQAAQSRGAKHVYGMLNGIQGLLADRYVDLSETITSTLQVELLKRTPSSYLGSCRCMLPEPDHNDRPYKQLFQLFEKLDIGYLFYIGGNDSMDTINKLSRYALWVGSDIRLIGVPKTIDNDLVETDHTPGFGSAAKYLAATVKEIIRDGLVYNQKIVTVVEVMGRNAGWLTGATSLSKGEDCEGIDMIFLPETVFRIDEFLERVNELQKQKPSIVIAVSEGAKTPDGNYVCELADHASFTDSFGHRSLSGAARFLANEAAQRLGCKTRSVELSTLQRCAGHITSRVDVTEAFQVGGAAVKAAMEWQTRRMVSLRRLSDDPYQTTTRLVPIEMVANKEKKVPQEWITEDGTGVTAEFESYVRPLIQAELTPFFVDGLPRHIHL
jgi:6-phosphofructokinase 1